MISYYGGEHLVNFERYAQVLSQNFNVRIYLDGTKAETHQDNSIHLPNIQGMSEQELDALFGILLHEIGHVKYSNLNNSQVKKIKGPDHFMIWNGVEDARIENKLMIRLEGANDIFEKLYGVHFKQLSKKIFGIEFNDDVDRWHLFSVHVHDYLLNTKHKYFNIEFYSKAVQKEVLDIFEKAKPIIDAHKLTKAEHSLTLASKLFKKFGPKKANLMKMFAEVFGDLGECAQELQDAYDGFANNPRLIELKKKKKELSAQRKLLKKEAEKSGNIEKNLEASNNIELASEMIDYLRYLKELKNLEDESKKLKGESEVKLAQIESIKKELAQGVV